MRATIVSDVVKLSGQLDSHRYHGSKATNCLLTGRFVSGSLAANRSSIESLQWQSLPTMRRTYKQNICLSRTEFRQFSPSRYQYLPLLKNRCCSRIRNLQEKMKVLLQPVMESRKPSSNWRTTFRVDILKNNAPGTLPTAIWGKGISGVGVGED